MIGRALNRWTHRIRTLPVVVLMPHSRCNCRCVMCDIWKANQHKEEISAELLARHLDAFRKLGVRHVTLSGGEALMHSNLWKFCELLKREGIRISLLSTGMTLKQNAPEVAQWIDDVIVSLDGSGPVHDRIRNVPSAFEKLSDGVAALREQNPSFRVTGRCVLQKANYFDFDNIVAAAERLGLRQISFLAADVSTTAFNRETPWSPERAGGVALHAEEVDHLEELLRASFTNFAHHYRSGFIAESPARMRAIVTYYNALLGKGPFPTRRCNAPWISAVVESTGDVRPCFFHKPYGNLNESDFETIVNGPAAVAFRKNLDIHRDATCERCVCSLHVGLWQSV